LTPDRAADLEQIPGSDHRHRTALPPGSIQRPCHRPRERLRRSQLPSRALWRVPLLPRHPISRLGLALILASLLATPGWAKTNKTKGGNGSRGDSPGSSFTLQDTGVAKVDKFYGRVENQVTRLQTARQDVQDANERLTLILDLPRGTPLADALEDLRSKAAGEIQLVLEGTKPVLQASDAVPDNLREAIDATNALVEDLSNAMVTLRRVKKRVKAMPEQATHMPRAIARSDLGLTEKAQASVIATRNLLETKRLATEAGALVQECRDSLKLIRSSFGD
jgi:hypothetical protein